MLKHIYIVFLLILLIINGCTFNDQNANNEVNLNYLDFLKNAKIVTVFPETKKTTLFNPYILADSQNEIENIASIIYKAKGIEINEINASMLSNNIYMIEFEDISYKDGKRSNYVFLFDYDKSCLYVNSRHNLANKFSNTKKPQYVVIKTNDKLKKLVDNAIKNAKPRFSQSEIKEREYKTKVTQPK